MNELQDFWPIHGQNLEKVIMSFAEFDTYYTEQSDWTRLVELAEKTAQNADFRKAVHVITQATTLELRPRHHEIAARPDFLHLVACSDRLTSMPVGRLIGLQDLLKTLKLR